MCLEMLRLDLLTSKTPIYAVSGQSKLGNTLCTLGRPGIVLRFPRINWQFQVNPSLGIPCAPWVALESYYDSQESIGRSIQAWEYPVHPGSPWNRTTIPKNQLAGRPALCGMIRCLYVFGNVTVGFVDLKNPHICSFRSIQAWEYPVHPGSPWNRTTIPKNQLAGQSKLCGMIRCLYVFGNVTVGFVDLKNPHLCSFRSIQAWEYPVHPGSPWNRTTIPKNQLAGRPALCGMIRCLYVFG